MQLAAIHVVFLIAGLLAGVLASWLVLKSRLSLAELKGAAGSEVERATLAEQAAGARKDLAQLDARLTEAEARARTLQAALDVSIREAAESGARARRVPELESALKQTAETLEAAQKEAATALQVLNTQFSDLREANGKLTADTAAKQRRIVEIEIDLKAALADKQTLSDELAGSKTAVATLSQELASERIQLQDKLALLEQARQTLSDQFKALASEILDEKSRKFTEQNQTNLDQLLSPLKQQLTDFKSKVEEVYVNEGKDRSALTEQVKQLMTLNQTLSQDANNLTLALKGDRKAQGNWGEIILDDVLEKAGLLRDQHYQRQGSVKSDDGQTHFIPDVIINLPGDRHLVVDSKLTLPDYRAFASADTDEERFAALKRHLAAIRNHIKGLSEKNYQSLYGLRSLDFVVMFIPLEPAFMMAVTHDRELFQQAWERNVLLVSPSTLLFVIRTVANLWRQEDLSRNAKEISSRGAELYDKLVGFVTDLNKVGERIEQAQASYHDAKKKLSEGGGNVIRQAEMLKKLGVKPSKQLPKQWVGSGGAELEGGQLTPPADALENSGDGTT
ncbi:MAG: putative periplasmic protein [Hydrocarboniphaga sp.]|uniref:DNA recombination protein RmuC n=1 Tax=Hydrocarboniphaga sp. TaxID=2033016 RepID=UPI00261F74E6|nr:DNA recombination protein RmuC [Hydrocarboniphaga sp.]MDB5967616.1 putative periplasmic protein [Hydrocarboniphaga sp.]